MPISELTTQRNTVGGPAGTNVTFTFPVAPSANNLVVFGFSWRGDTTVSTIPFSCALATNSGNGSGLDGAIYYKIASGTEGTTWTFTLAVSNKAAGVASEWSGIHPTPLDKINLNTATGTAGTTGTTGTLTQAQELVVALFANVDTATWSSHDNGLAEIGEAASTGGAASTRNTTSLATKITSATTDINYGATLSGSQLWSAAVATFKQAEDVPSAQSIVTPFARHTRTRASVPLLLATTTPLTTEELLPPRRMAMPFPAPISRSATVPLLLATVPPAEEVNVETVVSRVRWGYRMIWR